MSISRPWGMAPVAFEAHMKSCAAAKVNPDRISQTIGGAKASAGTHKQDGVLTINGKKIAYCAATDIGDNGMTHAQIKRLLNEYAKREIFGWFRNWPGNTHLHIVCAALDMKEALFLQGVDFLNDRTGLVGHATETFYTAPPELDRSIARALRRANPILWAKHEKRIPKAYREDIPPRLFLNGKQIKSAYLTGGAWYALESDLGEVLGGSSQTDLIKPVRVVLNSWGWKIAVYNPRLATMNRADIRAERVA